MPSVLMPDGTFGQVEMSRYNGHWMAINGKWDYFVMPLDEPEYYVRCDRCGKCGWSDVERDGSWGGIKTRSEWQEIFAKRPKEGFFDNEYCDECAAVLTPWVLRLRDISELTLYVNNFERAINNGKRKSTGTQDDGATADDAGERRQGCAERRPSHR